MEFRSFGIHNNAFLYLQRPSWAYAWGGSVISPSHILGPKTLAIPSHCHIPNLIYWSINWPIFIKLINLLLQFLQHISNIIYFEISNWPKKAIFQATERKTRQLRIRNIFLSVWYESFFLLNKNKKSRIINFIYFISAIKKSIKITKGECTRRSKWMNWGIFISKQINQNIPNFFLSAMEI